MKANRRFYLIVLVLFSSSIFARQKPIGPSKIHFLNISWEKVLTLARQQHKPIFVDAYATWCLPCREMKETTFKNRGIAAFFNKKYINVAIDVEKGGGASFADKFQVTSYPTLLFIDGDGRVIERVDGYADAKELMATAMRVK